MDLIRDRVIIETQAEQLLACLKAGTVSTNVHLRKLHNFCLSMNWLPWPLIPKRLWPEVRFQPKRAITIEEHQLIIEREKNPERRNFYELCWHLGGSQTDIANLKAEDIDWRNQTIAYARQKTGSLAMIHFRPGHRSDFAASARQLAPLFPYLQSVRCWRPRHGVQTALRGTWHQRRFAALLPLRLGGARQAMRLPGASSRRRRSATTARLCIAPYARKAKVKLPSLESYERQATEGRIIQLPPLSSERPGGTRLGQTVG